MPLDLLIMFPLMFGLILGPPFLLAFALFLLPGRKGRLRTERIVSHENMSLEEARALYLARLQHEQFSIAPGGDAGAVCAVRRTGILLDTHAHSDKPVRVELHFTPVPGGVQIKAVATIGDFIFYDSGEGRLIDLTLDRLLSADLEREPPPLVPNYSFTAMSSLTSAVLSVALLGLLMVKFISSAPTLRQAALVAGTLLGGLGAMGAAWQARRKIQERPAEIRGVGLVYLTLVVEASPWSRHPVC